MCPKCIRLRDERDFRARAFLTVMDHLAVLKPSLDEDQNEKLRAIVDQTRVELELADSRLAMHRDREH